MTTINKEAIPIEIDDTFTDGQMSDYLAAQEAGNDYYSNTQITYKCDKCGTEKIVVES